MLIFRWLAVALILSCTSIACREARPEADLPSSAYSGTLPRLVSNDRGFWFLVTDGEVELQPFVALGDGASRELLYAIPQGSRTVRLMPLTPYAYASLDAMRDQTVEATWLPTPADAGPDLPDSVGWTTGKSGETVSWAGEPLPDGSAVALVRGDAPPELQVSHWIAGTATIRGGRLANVRLDEGESGPFAILPDGDPPAGPMTVAATGIDVPTDELWEVRAANVDLPPPPVTRFSYRPLAVKTGADVLLTSRDGKSADAIVAHPVVRRGLAVSASDEPLTVAAARVPDLLRGYAALRSGSLLAATNDLLAARTSSGANPTAGAMRALELLAAAGYVDWMRNSFIANAVGLDADAALYLGRGHYLGGDYTRADEFAARAEERFALWHRPSSHVGGGRALLLRARVAAQRGEWETAFELASAAAEHFDEVDDAMRAAEAEIYASTYALNARDARRAVKSASLARSRFFHGHSGYHSALAELALSDIYRRVGEQNEARKMARYALLRFEEMGDEVGRNRARIAEGRISGARSRAQSIREIEIALEKSQASGDLVGVLDAVASLVVMGGASSSETASHGLAIIRGLGRTDDPYVRARANQALALLCDRGLGEAVASAGEATRTDLAGVRAACNVAVEAQPGDTEISSLIDRGWAALGSGDLDEARRIGESVKSSVDEELRQTMPRQAADALFFAAAVEQQDSPSVAADTVTTGMQLLSTSVDPTRLAATYAELAERYVARGQTWLAADLLGAAMATAADQGQAELRRSYAIRRVEILHAAGQWDDAAMAIRDAEPVVETAGAQSAPLLARLYTLQEDVFHRTGKKADASIAGGKAAEALEQSEPAERVQLTVLAATLAADRGDVSTAKERLGRADALERGLADGLLDDQERRLLRAQIELTRAQLALGAGDAGPAGVAYRAALDAVSGLKASEEVLRSRLRALVGVGETATSDDEVTQTVKELEAARGTAATDFPAMLPTATEALARLEISAGRPSRALELVESANMEGGVASNGLDSLCLKARAMGLSGRPEAGEMLEQCAQRESGTRAVDAALLAAFVDAELTKADRQRRARELAATHAQTLPKRHLERLKIVNELAVGDTRASESRDQQLQARVSRASDAGDARRTVAAVVDQADYLIDTGRSSEAIALLDQTSSAFYEASAESPGTLARLRTRAVVASLDPVAAFNVAARAISETDDMSASDEAELLLTAATNDVLLGMWQLARSHLADAHDRAKTARDRRLQRRIEAFADRFAIPLGD